MRENEPKGGSKCVKNTQNITKTQPGAFLTTWEPGCEIYDFSIG